MGVLKESINKVNNDYKDILLDISEKEYFINLDKVVSGEYDNFTIYPAKEDIFNAFKFCRYSNTKVVVIGQDPYHEPNEAMGLSFSVKNGFKMPPSLRNIFKELKDDLSINRINTDLTNIACQGVLFLNQILTVRKGLALSHKDIGWNNFIIDIISQLNKLDFVIYILWGKSARSLKKYINDNSYIIESAHPSPLSSYHGFFGSKPFSKTNIKLIEKNMDPIDWSK